MNDRTRLDELAAAGRRPGRIPLAGESPPTRLAPPPRPAPRRVPSPRPGFSELATAILGLVSIGAGVLAGVSMISAAQGQDTIQGIMVTHWMGVMLLLGGLVQGAILLAISTALMYLRRITERMERS